MPLSDAKILVTGPAGQIAFPLVESLVADNEVWGIARFGDEGARQKVDALGVTTRAIDVGSGEFGDLPTDFTHVLHLAASMAPGLDYDGAIRVNAEGTGLLLQHCRAARGVLVMSTHSVYKPQDDPWHVFVETDPVGDCNSQHAATYSVSKLGEEAVARYCARAFDLPVVIARMNAAYGPNGGLPAYHLDAIVAGRPVTTRWDPCLYSPIFQDDINDQAEALLAAASVPATIVNWAGDEPVSVQEWAAYTGELAGTKADVVVTEIPGTLRGSVADNTKRASFTGPCRVGWREGFRRTFAARHQEVPA
jgi:nucleoside-diphosphate-sugar epimerase